MAPMSETVYDRIGRGYATTRRANPRIAARIDLALGDAESVVNVGAGAGSYEPVDRDVIAVEPSREMIAQRRRGAAQAICGSAERLPLLEDAVDAAMTILSIHHWDDPAGGVAEMRRVARRRIVVLTYDPGYVLHWWLGDYAPRSPQTMPSAFRPSTPCSAGSAADQWRRSRFPRTAPISSSGRCGLDLSWCSRTRFGLRLRALRGWTLRRSGQRSPGWGATLRAAPGTSGMDTFAK